MIITRPILRIALAILMLTLSLIVSITTGVRPLHAATTPASTVGVAQTTRQPAGLGDPGELERFLDGVFAEQLEQYHIPGATVSIVQDGALLVAQGYGYADAELHTPVEPGQTLFRIGSVSKLFTWTAVMQQVEQGKLDLHADVNTYLHSFKIPATYPQPITLAHLLTHTAGFEDRDFGITVAGAADLIPLGAYLARDLPARVLPPGVVTSYSNYGATLAGYLVEQVAGVPFEQYIEDRILEPLEMRDSTVAQPLPAHLAERLATGYTPKDTQNEAEAFEYFQIGPAAGMSATATDMARFMIAHLQDGRAGTTQILQVSTAQDMHRQHFSNAPQVSGMTYGFAEMQLNRQQLITHSGSTNNQAFQSLLVLLPAHNVGVFVSYNGRGGNAAKSEFLQRFLDHAYPVAPTEPLQPPADFAQRAARFAGSYQSTRMNVTTLEKVAGLMPGNVAVRVTTDGALAISGGAFGADEHECVEVAPLTFRQVNGEEMMAFREDGQGRITHLFKGNLPVWAFHKLAWYDIPTVHYGLLAGCALIFLSAGLLWPLAWLVSRRKQTPRGARQASIANWIGWGTSLLFILFPILFVIGIADLSITPLAQGALLLALLATALTVGVLIYAGLAWRWRWWSLGGRLHYSLVALATLAFVLELNYWNLLGFHW
jgi:CubicO group peptidase (beta-lactamase class C family)